MYIRALAADYDGTLAHRGVMDEATVQALLRLRQSGRRIILVTGREVTELRHVVADLKLFDRVVAENGGVLYDPATAEERLLAPGPPAVLVHRLIERGVEPLSVGRTIVATWQPHEAAVLAAIAELGLDHQIIFNKGAVMVLPTGVNKASGLAMALRDLGLSAANVVGVGDAENDRSFLAACGGSAAVANALESLKQTSDIKLGRDHGGGVAELIDRVLKEDASLLPPARRGVYMGTDLQGNPVRLTSQESLLMIGGSGSGKSRFATALIERMIDRNFEVCVLDPEGEYENLDNAVSIGDDAQAGSIAEAVRLLSKGMSVSFDTVAINLVDRRCLFERLMPQLAKLREATGRPHWIVVDEAHHYLPISCARMGTALARAHEGLVLATIDPDWLPRVAINAMDHVLSFGSTASDLLEKSLAPLALPRSFSGRLSPDEALLWSREAPTVLRILRIDGPRHGHERHRGKYAVGDVGEAHSFYFGWSPDGRVFRACNLAEFVSKGDLLPDEIWLRHLHAGDFAAWFLHVIRDDELGSRTEDIAKNQNIGAKESRQQIAAAIRGRYAIP